MFFTIYVCMFVAARVYAWVQARKSEEEAASFRAEIPDVCRIPNLLKGAGIWVHDYLWSTLNYWTIFFQPLF